MYHVSKVSIKCRIVQPTAMAQNQILFEIRFQMTQYYLMLRGTSDKIQIRFQTTQDQP
jgi:hypothetical protein